MCLKFSSNSEHYQPLFSLILTFVSVLGQFPVSGYAPYHVSSSPASLQDDNLCMLDIVDFTLLGARYFCIFFL